MLKKIRKALCGRIAEMFIGSVAMSAFVCVLCVSGLLPIESAQRGIVLTTLPIVYLLWNFRTLRKCYSILCNDKIYYISNICATGAFIITSILAFVWLPSVGYSWLFLVTGLGSFLNIGIPGKIAILSFHTILTVSIFLAPIGLGWIKIKAKERRELRKRKPGRLKVNPLENKPANTETHTNESKETENALS